MKLSLREFVGMNDDEKLSFFLDIQTQAEEETKGDMGADALSTALLKIASEKIDIENVDVFSSEYWELKKKIMPLMDKFPNHTTRIGSVVTLINDLENKKLQECTNAVTDCVEQENIEEAFSALLTLNTLIQNKCSDESTTEEPKTMSATMIMELRAYPPKRLTNLDFPQAMKKAIEKYNELPLKDPSKIQFMSNIKAGLTGYISLLSGKKQSYDDLGKGKNITPKESDINAILKSMKSIDVIIKIQNLQEYGNTLPKTEKLTVIKHCKQLREATNSFLNHNFAFEIQKMTPALMMPGFMDVEIKVIDYNKAESSVTCVLPTSLLKQYNPIDQKNYAYNEIKKELPLLCFNQIADRAEKDMEKHRTTATSGLGKFFNKIFGAIAEFLGYDTTRQKKLSLVRLMAKDAINQKTEEQHNIGPKTSL